MISLRWLKSAWNRFFFKPIPSTAIGLFRIGVGGLSLLNLVMLWPDIGMWYTEKGVLPSSVAQRLLYGPRLSWMLLIRYFTNDDEFGANLFILTFAVLSFLLMIGLFSRVVSILVFGCMVSLHHRNIFILHSGDTMLRLYCFFLMFTPCGAALSADRLWRVFTAVEDINTPTDHEPWGQRLIQFQICVLYISTGLWKIRGEHWVRGTASYVTLQLDEFKRFYIPEFLRQSLIFSGVGTWFTLIAEFSMGTIVWLKELCPYVLAMALFLHLSLDYTMNVPLFQYVMIIGLLLFLKPGQLEIWGARIRGYFEPKAHKKLPVYFDGDCGLCTQVQKVFFLIDWFGTCEWMNFRTAKKSQFREGFDKGRAEQELLVYAKGSWYGGFYAFRKIAHRLPLAWPLLPLLYLPGVAYLGRLVYRAVATNRMALSEFLFGDRVIECPLPDAK